MGTPAKTVEADTGWRRVSALAELPENQPAGAVVDEVDVVLLRRGESVRAFDARCPHEGALLSEGFVDGERLVCRSHNWQFDVESGERCDGTPKACLRKHNVKIEQGEVFVNLRKKRGGKAPLVLATPKRTLADLPGPRGYPIVGNLFQMSVARMHAIHEEWAKQFGPLFKFSIANQTIVVVADHELIATVLAARPNEFRRASLLETLTKELQSYGVFSAEGTAWRSQRRLAMESLSQKHTRAIYPTLKSIGERLHARLERLAEAGQPVAIHEDFMRYTVDVLTSLVFGSDTRTLDGDDDVIQNHLNHVFAAISRRMLSPLPYWRWFKFGADRIVDKSLVEIRRYQDKLISERRARIAARPENERVAHDFIEAMLLARDETGQPYEEEVIYGNMLTLMLGGEDTSANTLGWVLHLVCDRPDIWAKMRAEVDEAMGEDLVARDLATINNLPYVDGVINEALRLRRPVPLLNLETNVDFVLGDLMIPKKTMVHVITGPPQLDEKNFVNAHEIIPERWLPDRPAGAHVPAAHLPFGGGPRSCPARSFSMLEMRLALSTFVKSFDVSRVGDPEEVKELFKFGTAPVDLRVKVSRRARPLLGP